MSVIKVSNIQVYPIKSIASVSLQKASISALGIDFDRRFVVCDSAGKFITGRTKPQLCLINAQLTELGVILSAPNMADLNLYYQNFSEKYKEVTVWQDKISGQVCSLQADNWFSEYLQKDCQLLFFGKKSRRGKKPNTPQARQLAFADGYPLLLTSQASLDDLNQRLAHAGHDKVSMAQFRPNIVVENCLTFAEDSWQHIRIGTVEFIVSKPCERCVFITVDPKTGKKHPQYQPLQLLKSYRKTLSGEILFGQNIIPLNKGEIKQGDQLTVLTTQNPPTFQ